MVIREQAIGLEAFFAFIERPENAGRDFELVEGRIIEVVSHGYSSQIAARIIGLLTVYLLKNDIGILTGADGGYMVMGHPYIPDVAFLSYERQPEPTYNRGYNVLAPELAVEVLSPSNTDAEMTPKVVNYLNAGTVVWVVNPDAHTITVYQPNTTPKTYLRSQTIDASPLLDGFTLRVADAFPARPVED